LYCYFISGKGYWRAKKFEHDPNKLPIISFSTGMKGKDAVKFKGPRFGVVGEVTMWKAGFKRFHTKVKKNGLD
jgi:hypothetical protein